MEEKNLTAVQEPEAKKSPVRRQRKDIDFLKLRQDAGRQLNERLQKGDLSTADLLKVMAFCPPQKEETAHRNGDWVLVLQGDK
ncbi:MAG: hypothetical protein GX858_04300 [Clostridiales bacterium]|nr:hypothetical protein [Clostridiales bacterium]